MFSACPRDMVLEAAALGRSLDSRNTTSACSMRKALSNDALAGVSSKLRLEGGQQTGYQLRVGDKGEVVAVP